MTLCFQADRHVGIAVSGGVDSMALAGLCKRLQNSKPNLYRFHAIVVDHKARSGSTQEAAEVQQVLEMMGKFSMPPCQGLVCQF